MLAAARAPSARNGLSPVSAATSANVGEWPLRWRNLGDQMVVRHSGGDGDLAARSRVRIGHLLQVDAVIAVDDGLLVRAANAIADQVREELFEHIPALAVANVRFATFEDSGAEHAHHAPKPFAVAGRLADGLLEIVDTPAGERMRLRVSRNAEGMRARVDIARADGQVETPELRPAAGNHHRLESAVAPAEPHAFDAKLWLAAGGETEDLPFSIIEPQGHQH
ncbi:MAG: hypothetical protein ABI216_08055 [Devosia sp.]